MSASAHDSSTAIAVIGLSGRFPGAPTLEQFWRNIRGGVESISFFTKEELRAVGFSSATIEHPRYVRARGVLEGADLFDAAFFGYTPREAQMMDPQQRVFLECGFHALENAGYDGDSCEGAIGVYAGTSVNSYLLRHVVSNPEIAYSLGTDKDFLATRLSYKLNLRGPSITIQTACSTSLVAVCYACQALLDYHCDIAIAGGASVTVPQKCGYFYQEGGIFSPDGHCRAFDASARGTVTGDGVGAVVLKRLSDAVADGDTIHAVVRGFALNNDGAAKIGYTAPSIDGQAQAIAMAQSLAGVEPDTITYVETHGTGTELGDPIEIAALTKAFRAGTGRKGFCRIGSVKTNIGHLDVAAGIAGFIKTVLALEHREVPPSLHFERPNPKIDFDASPFRVNTQLADWPAGPQPRRAGVSSFGIGGTNAHVVLEEAPLRPASGTSRAWQVLPVSARTESALETVTDDLVAWFEAHPQTNLADVAHTLQTGRRRFAHRRIVVGRTAPDTAATLSSRTRRRVVSRVQEPGDRPVVFMFPGQGTQRYGMARGVYEQEPVFRRAFDACADRLAPHLGLDLRRVLYSADGADAGASLLTRTSIVQGALFATEYALAQLWMAWGVTPHAMIGHSIGEYVAACLSGVLSLDVALRLISERGRLMEAAPPGVMTAVPLPAAEARELLDGDLWMCAVNAPSLCVVGGTAASVDEFEARLSDGGIECHRLQTPGAFHSGLMAGVAEPLTALVRTVRVGRPSIPYVSNLTGTWIGEPELSDPGYWARQVRETVLFEAGIRALLDFGARVFLEVGPGQVLGTIVRQALSARDGSADVSVVSSLPYITRDPDDGESIATAMGELWLNGVDPDWRAYRADERRHRAELPPYPFERKRYWVVPKRMQPGRGRSTVDDALYIPSWKRSLDPAAPAAAPARCLVFAHEADAGDDLARRLRERGSDVLIVRPGEAFERVSEREWTIRAESRADYDALLADLQAAGGWPDAIVHAWSLSPPRTTRNDSVATQLALGFQSVVLLVQALADAVAPPLRLHVMTDGVYDITGDEPLQPARAAVLGVCRVASQELPNLRCRHIDLQAPGIEPLGSALFDRLAIDLAAGSEPVVAYRGTHRWVESVERIALPAPDRVPARLRHRGTYLITGGLGAIGLAIARYLAEAVQARLVLTSRTGLPPRQDWDERLASLPAEDAMRRRIEAIRAMERAGAEVLVSAVDVVDGTGMRAVVQEAHARFGAIHGVVHAAGVPGGGVIQLKTPQAAAAVLAPKVEGTLVLERVLEDQLDFTLLCSSLASIVGGAGQVDYCAANAFLDAYARRRTARDGALTIAIAWDTWADAGMAVDTRLPEPLQKLRAEALRRGLSTDEGIDIVRRALSGPAFPQLLVSLDDLRAAAAVSQPGPEEREGQAATPIDDEAGAPSNPRPNLPHAFVPPADETERRICALWESLLGVRPVGARDSYFELGGHSLLAIHLMARLNREFGTAIPVARLYEGLTPAFLADLVRGGSGAAPPAEPELLAAAKAPTAHRDEIRRRRLGARRSDRPDS